MVSYAFGETNGDGAPDGLTIGAENRDGTSGVNLDSISGDGSEVTVLTSPGTGRRGVTLDYVATGNSAGAAVLRAIMSTDVTNGETVGSGDHPGRLTAEPAQHAKGPVLRDRPLRLPAPAGRGAGCLFRPTRAAAARPRSGARTGARPVHQARASGTRTGSGSRSPGSPRTGWPGRHGSPPTAGRCRPGAGRRGWGPRAAGGAWRPGPSGRGTAGPRRSPRARGSGRPAPAGAARQASGWVRRKSTNPPPRRPRRSPRPARTPSPFAGALPRMPSSPRNCGGSRVGLQLPLAGEGEGADLDPALLEKEHVLGLVALVEQVGPAPIAADPAQGGEGRHVVGL